MINSQLILKERRQRCTNDKKITLGIVIFLSAFWVTIVVLSVTGVFCSVSETLIPFTLAPLNVSSNSAVLLSRVTFGSHLGIAPPDAETIPMKITLNTPRGIVGVFTSKVFTDCDDRDADDYCVIFPPLATTCKISLEVVWWRDGWKLDIFGLLKV